MLLFSPLGMLVLGFVMALVAPWFIPPQSHHREHGRERRLLERQNNDASHLHGRRLIVLVRNRRRVARLVPEPPSRNALDVFGNLYRTLDDRTADALSSVLSKHRKSRTG